MINQGIISTPVGALYLESSEKGLRTLRILSDEDAAQVEYGYDPSLSSLVDQLYQYFDGELEEFNVKLDLSGYPEFYVEVWRALCTIPYGRTRTYSQMAQFMQNPRSARAVGNASAHNPIAIIVPCHRVIGKNGRMTGYLYGKNIKRKLLQLETPGHYALQGQLWDKIQAGE